MTQREAPATSRAVSAFTEPTTLVVPCHNEARRLSPERFVSFAQAHPALRFVFVDDGSTDATGSALEAAQRELGERALVLSLARNVGKAEAVRAGLLRALDAESPQLVGYWDADLSTPLEALPAMLEELRAHPRAEALLGARVMLLGRDIRRRPVRHYPGRVFATFASLLLDLPVYDTQCGAKLFRVGPWLREVLAEPFRSRWVFDVELLARMERARAARGLSPLRECVREFPLDSWHDVRGGHLSPLDLPRAALDLALLYRRERRAR